MTSVRLSEKLDNELGVIARQQKRSKSFIIREAVERYLAEAREDAADLAIAERILNDPDRVMVSHEDVMARFEARMAKKTLMTWSISWAQTAENELEWLDSVVQKRIVKKINTYLSHNPASLGKSLTGNLSGTYSYRIGYYRVLYALFPKEKRMEILHIRHRRDVYEDE